MTKLQFDKLGVKYVELNLQDSLDDVERFKAMGFTSSPIVETDTKVWSGFRLDKIQSLARHLKSQGEK